ncbi:MAG: hypothetical protein VX656_10260, partial [Candidatus Latescibacterota bacterium]|nr:hypothetical protein [Candidatus Latescibacterota bacterium]
DGYRNTGEWAKGVAALSPLIDVLCLSASRVGIEVDVRVDALVFGFNPCDERVDQLDGADVTGSQSLNCLVRRPLRLGHS